MLRLDTLLAQAGRGTDPRTGAISTPIYQTSTYAHPGLGQSTGFDYSRSANPTRQALEEAVAALDGAAAAFAFASGLAALTTVLCLLRQGDRVAVAEGGYGGTYRLLDQVFARFGLSADYVGVKDAEDFRAALRPETRMILAESVSNPCLEVPDIPALAQIAREAGLGPLAQSLRDDPSQVPEMLAAAFIDAERGVADVKAALDGARQILMEQFAEDAVLLSGLRDYLWENAVLRAQLVEGKAEEGAKFRDYFDYREACHRIPSHRALALFRGRNEGVLHLTLEIGAPDVPGPDPGEQRVAAHFRIGECGRPGDAWLRETVRWAWKIKLLPHLDTEIKQRLREAAEEEAIRVFARNLRDLLLAAPAGARATLGLDPGLRTGVKVAVVDATGKLVETATLYPHPPRNQWQDSLRLLAELCARHRVELISIGNGTASRETDRLATELLQRCPELRLQKRVVSEAGASVYSASELAAREFPEVDVSPRGAGSIARRLQDPLAELVKIEPKAIGVGQYQHDVSQTRLARSLDAVVEDCVNAVGVDVNTASAPLLARVAGLNATLARNIVEFRDANGPFRRREQLLKVARLGDKTFEQAAGFLRIVNGDNPLDRSAVHPEAYPVIERILAASGRGLHEVLGNAAFLKTLDAVRFTDVRFGLPTVRDILALSLIHI